MHKSVARKNKHWFVFYIWAKLFNHCNVQPCRLCFLVNMKDTYQLKAVVWETAAARASRPEFLRVVSDMVSQHRVPLASSVDPISTSRRLWLSSMPFHRRTTKAITPASNSYSRNTIRAMFLLHLTVSTRPSLHAQSLLLVNNSSFSMLIFREIESKRSLKHGLKVFVGRKVLTHSCSLRSTEVFLMYFAREEKKIHIILGCYQR